MTDEELAAIKARVEKAVPGMWEYDSMNHAIFQRLDSRGWPYGDWVAHDVLPDIGAFIVHAHADVLTLIAEVERLRGERKE